MTQFFHLPQISQQDNRLNWGGLSDNVRGLVTSELCQLERPLLVLTKDLHQAERLRAEIDFFKPAATPVMLFPDWETLPFDHFSPHQDIVSQRLALLSKLPQIKRGIIIASTATLMHRLVPKDYLMAHGFCIRCGENIDIITLRDQLSALGYHTVNQVIEHGELSLRGAIIDIFPMGSHCPFRIEFFDNEVESIREFDPSNQRSSTKIDAINLLPAYEVRLDSDGINHFRQAWHDQFDPRTRESSVYQQVSQGEAVAGINYYLPLFFDQTACFFDYLPDNTLCLLDEVQTAAQQFWQEIKTRYENLKHDIYRPLCPPQTLFLSPNEFNTAVKPLTRIQFNTSIDNSHYDGTSHYQIAADLSIEQRHKEPLSKLKSYLSNYQGRVLFCTESNGRCETLMDLLASIQIMPQRYASWQDFLDGKEKIAIVVAPIEQGMMLTDPAIAIITENQLFGESVRQQRRSSLQASNPDFMIRNLSELSVGAPVVHINHGVGRYLGLETLTTGDISAEYLTLQYANEDKIYVPISALQLISRYSGADSDHAPLQKLGSRQWEKTKQKAAEKIRDTAAELLDIYGSRMASQGHAFSIDEAMYQQFAQSFPFSETPDQHQAIKAVLDDMQSTRCMDRLICGDVGFGKTEIAMRAAFIAATANKQVALLVPTTLLATQHLQNFKDRFANWPLSIAGLSRMETPQAQRTTIAGLQKGEIDIVIGTHKLLSDSIQFKDLGLLIVDEEQRFGVRQKERITALRAHIDILTLTATPIPRTLNMALAGTRDLSIIATPPPKRLSVKTFIHEAERSLIREAILREIMRGGQVYFLHNDVATIKAQAEKIKQWVPEARIAIAHGQLRERELEKTMLDFYHQRFNVLVCSTIIESGIDVPTANTIIIHRADRFGLSQLHQLRGRVGRSHHQAYAYLLTPPEKAMTKDALKRLSAIAELGDLGIGFTLATHDLEIRGAGELLGEEQSGEIHAIGFSLYMELLEEAVKAIKSGKTPQFTLPLKTSTEIDLGVSALLPEDYIPDVSIRLTLYKRLANCKTVAKIQDFKAELIDRFGLLPEVAQNLLTATQIKLKAEQLGIHKIEIASKFGYLNFNKQPNIDADKLIQLIQKNFKHYQLIGTEKLRFTLNKQKAIAEQLETLLNHLQNPS